MQQNDNVGVNSPWNSGCFLLCWSCKNKKVLMGLLLSQTFCELQVRSIDGLKTNKIINKFLTKICSFSQSQRKKRIWNIMRKLVELCPCPLFSYSFQFHEQTIFTFQSDSVLHFRNRSFIIQIQAKSSKCMSKDGLHLVHGKILPNAVSEVVSYAKCFWIMLLTFS